jgi:CheY-like chemotaxis protein
MRILVVDDDPVSRKALTSILAARGNEILTAGAGSEAIRLCRDDPDIRLIVMDVMLTDGNGVSIAREIEKSCNVSVLFTSGTPVTGLVAQGFLKPEEVEDAGFYFLSKPFTASEVWVGVERALSGKGEKGDVLS